MQPLILATALWLSPALALAADAGPAPAGAKAPRAQPAAKPAPKVAVRKAAPAKKSANEAKAAPEAVTEVIVLTPEEQAIAQRVYTGRIACELGAVVQIDPDPKSPGSFFVSGKGFRYHMRPMVSATSTVRLEDQHAGAVWLQIANKSMLMNQKLGHRMADECMSEQQAQVTQAMKTAPAPSLFDSAPAGSR
ncbi:MAG: hypothetical protein OZ923_12380 [Comamonadaceae bacterium]|nr:hypothetical protein [Burkholderiales bacterium]MEB2349394.1 hypothetical protein [Comamonadaceae bacterium]